MHVHFIAIGGAAIHNLAIALHNKGYQITGSDIEIQEPSKSRLEQKGMLPEIFGWFPEKISSSMDAVVFGRKVKADNPEVLKAKELGLNIYSYAEFIYEQSKHKTRVVIGGSKGKTTIASMILHVMEYHDRDVDYIVGAPLDGLQTLAKLTDDNDFIVLEGDEALSSPTAVPSEFNFYKPNIALLSGIAWNYGNLFPNYEGYVEQFKLFVDSIVKGGSITYNEEDEGVRKVVEASENTIRKLPYQTPAFKIEDGKTLLETPEGLLPIEIFGQHNLRNLAGAKWICQHMGVDEDDFFEAIASFKGAE